MTRNFDASSARLIGVISDTHGRIRSEAIEAFAGADLVIHAGDVGSADVLDALRDVAPLVAVRGNVDNEWWARKLPSAGTVKLGESLAHVQHDLGRLSVDPWSEGLAAVISGHSHRPNVHREDGVLFLNPGSAGPKRSGKPVSVALLRIEGGRLEPELIEIEE